MEVKPREKLSQENILVIAGGHLSGENIRKIIAYSDRDLNELFSIHEEAGTRMILHVAHIICHFTLELLSDVLMQMILFYFFHSKGCVSNDI